MKDYNSINWDAIVYYDETSPSCLRWKVDRYRGKHLCQKFITAGKPCGYKDTLGYWNIHLKGVMYKIHRVVYILHNGVIDNELGINHIDCNRGNNQKSNLELVTQFENANRKSIHVNGELQRNNTSGYNGYLIM